MAAWAPIIRVAWSQPSARLQCDLVPAPAAGAWCPAVPMGLGFCQGYFLMQSNTMNVAWGQHGAGCLLGAAGRGVRHWSLVAHSTAANWWGGEDTPVPPSSSILPSPTNSGVCSQGSPDPLPAQPCAEEQGPSPRANQTQTAVESPGRGRHGANSPESAPVSAKAALAPTHAGPVPAIPSQTLSLLGQTRLHRCRQTARGHSRHRPQPALG